MPNMYQFRPLQLADIPRLTEINPTFVANTVIQIQRTGQPPWQGWQVAEAPRQQPFDKGKGYDFDSIERDNILRRYQAGDGLMEVIMEAATGQIVGILEVEWERWRNAAWIWNIMLDVQVRGQGLGRIMIQRTVAWAQDKKIRAILLETQSNNPAACHFYAKMGFRLIGVNDLFYTNHDISDQEVALFWGLTLT